MKSYGSDIDNKLVGKPQNDYIEGRGGNDSLYAGAGNDQLMGGDGNDRLYGEDGNDWLNGGNGDDGLFGGSGNDTLIGGAGADVMLGGVGRDTFMFRSITDSLGNSYDTINDFQTGSDKIDLSAIDANELISGNQPFSVVAKFTGTAGELLIENTYPKLGIYLVAGDVDGDGKGDFMIKIGMFLPTMKLSASDFIL